MHVIAAVLLALHGLAHFVGVRAAFSATQLPLRRLVALPRALEGIIWLLLGVGFIDAAGLLLAQHDSWRALLLWAVGGSLLMCVVAWPEAKIGLVIDAVLLVLVLVLSPSTSGSHLVSAFHRELRHAAVATPVVAPAVIDEPALAELPGSVQRYLRFMGAVGRPRDVSLRASFSARFRRDRGAWLACEAIQYDSRAPVTRVYLMQLSLGRVLPVTVRDEYLRGRGTLRAKAFDLLSVADGDGYELDVGELVTYLNDALLMAPSLLLGPEATWTEVDERSFEVRLTDGNVTVKGRLWLDARGAPTSFSTTDRFFDAPHGKRVRTEWRTPIDGWQQVNGRSLPTRAQAVWMLPSGPFPYADFTFEPARIAFNVAPG